MRRLAPCTTVVLLWLTGCQTPPARDILGPPPGPILATRAPRITRPIAPPPRPVHHRPRPSLAAGPVSAADVRVRGGINRAKWEVIIVHHSGQRKATPEGMHNYHKDIRGWANGLGYHFVIGNGVNYPDGELYVGRRWKKQLTGAHCATDHGRYLGVKRPGNYFNKHGIGVCLIGNFENERPTARQLRTLTSLLAVLSREAGIHPSRVFGHAEVTHRTACPGRRFDMRAVRGAVAAAVTRGSHTASARRRVSHGAGPGN